MHTQQRQSRPGHRADHAPTQPQLPPHDPRQDCNNYRRHPNGCRFYREDWSRDDVLYVSICLLGMSPETRDDEWQCMTARRKCWRLAQMEKDRDSA